MRDAGRVRGLLRYPDPSVLVWLSSRLARARARAWRRETSPPALHALALLLSGAAPDAASFGGERELEAPRLTGQPAQPRCSPSGPRVSGWANSRKRCARIISADDCCRPPVPWACRSFPWAEGERMCITRTRTDGRGVRGPNANSDARRGASVANESAIVTEAVTTPCISPDTGAPTQRVVASLERRLLDWPAFGLWRTTRSSGLG